MINVPGFTVAREYMGRIYLVPLDRQGAENTQIYINFGWNSTDGQNYPVRHRTQVRACM